MKKDAQLGNEIKKLQYQLSYSEHINKQLSEHLAFVCEKMGMPIKKSKSIENINLINVQNHLQELYYVEPLLMAYQHKTQLLEEELKQLRQDSDSLIEFGEEIVSQNAFLRKELQNKNQYIMKSEQIGLNVNFLKLDNENLIEKNHVLQEKNHFLMEKLKELESNNQKNRLNLSIPQQNLNETKKQLRSQKQKLKQYEMKVIELEKKLQIVSNQLNNQRSMLKQQQRKAFQLQNQVIKLKNDLKISRQQHQSYQIAHEGISGNLQLQLQTLKTQLSAAQRRENELFTKNMALQTEVQDRNAKAHNLSLQNTQLQTNNNNILQMLQTYQVKVNSQAKKIKQLQTEIKDYAETSIHQRKQCEMLQWKLSQKEKAIEKKESQWKKERERISKMWEDRLQSTKKAMYQQKQGLYEQIHNLKTDGAKVTRR